MISALLVSLLLGIVHCLEGDHLVALTNLSTRSTNKSVFWQGASWGIGHSLPILIIGLIYTYFRMNYFLNPPFNFEIIVGVLLMLMGGARFIYRNHKNNHQKSVKALLVVGLVHGIAGSSGVILIHIGETSESQYMLFYLLAFSTGTILGMGVVNFLWQKLLIRFMSTSIVNVVMSIVAICYGGIIVYENLNT